MIFNRINHIAVICSDLEVSKSFYVDKLDFKILDRIDRPGRESTILFLDAGNAIIELFSFPDPPERPSYPEARGLRHLAFDVEDFDKTLDRLNAMGITIEPVRTDARTGKRMTFFKDPDDLPLEICEM